MLPAMEALLAQQEGFRATPYRDSRGFLTIGYGTNLDAGITCEQAQALMNCQLAANEDALIKYRWFLDLDDVRASVIENMAYNIGVNGVLGFHDMIAAIEAGDWAEAAHQMRASDWRVQVGERALVLARIMETGVMQDAAV